MLLACDIGNTRIKTALFNEFIIEDVNSFQNVEELLDYIYKLKVNDIAVCSVVPAASAIITEQLKKNNLSPLIINPNLKFNLKNQYQTPDTLGMDRLCSSEGAFYLYTHSSNFNENKYSENDFIVTIDFGTATTLNFIKYPGIFMGGIIAPGINMMFNSLAANTARLPNVTMDNYKDIIGADTSQSISSGVLNSSLGLIERAINHLKQNLKINNVIIYVTGGNSNTILNHLNFEFIFEESLVLIGIRSIWEVNRK